MELKQIIGLLCYLCIFFIPVLACTLIRRRGIGFKYWLLSFVLSWVVMVITVLALWFGYDCYLSYKMSLLDTNSDGIWSNQEMESWTEDDHNTMNRYYGDGGRNVFAVFIFPIFSLVYSLFVTAIYWAVANKRRKNA